MLRADVTAAVSPPRVVAVGACLCLLACQHYESDLPGVLDLRSDGMETPVESRPLPKEAAREGLESWMKGQGVTGSTDVIAEDRAVWALRLWALGDGLKPEVETALAGPGALRRVTLKEELSALDAAFFACTLPIPCVDLATLTLLPSFTVQLSGTRLMPRDVPPARDIPAPGVELAPAAPPEPTPAVDRPAAPPSRSP